MKNYSTLKRVIFISFIVSPFAFNGYAFQQAVPSPETGKIKGTIIDSIGARIIGAEIVAGNGQQKFVAKVNEEGIIEQTLPVGIYKITVNAQGFCPFIRKAVAINANS